MATTHDIVDTAVAAGNFSTLVTAVKAAGLVETLKGAGPFTVFAPTDEAFAKVPKATLEGLLADKAALTKVLTYHVVAGKVMAADVKAGHVTDFGSEGTQPPLGGMSNIESAQEQLQASLHEFADTAGISGQLLPAPGMPFGFYMELPKPGVLGTSEELPLQAWWFLANLSGQVDSDYDATLNLADLEGNLALPDTGAGGFRQALADDAQWALAVEQRLGGEPLIAASSIFTIVTDAQHPLCEPAMQLIAHIRTLRLYQAEAAGAAR